MIKINASMRIQADWFDDMSPEQQKKYVEEHPDSEHAERYDNARDAEDDINRVEDDANDKADRIKWVRKQLTQLSQDIDELKAEGEDYSKERRLRDKYRAELQELTS